MAAGVELEAGAVEPFRRALAAHAGAALTPADLIPVERVDAVVPGGVLGLELRRGARGAAAVRDGQPAADAARARRALPERDRRWGRSASTRASRWSRRAARARAASRSAPPPKALAPRVGGRPRHRAAARAQPLERGGRAAHDPARAVSDAGRRAARAGRGRRLLGAPSASRSASRRRGPAPTALHAPLDRRREGFAGVAGDLFTSGERVLVAVADVERRRQGLEQIVAGLAPGPHGGAPRGRRSPPTRSWPPATTTWSRSTRPPGGLTRPAAAPGPARPPGLGPGRGRVRAPGVASRARPAPGAGVRLPGAARAARPAGAGGAQSGARGRRALPALAGVRAPA